MKQKAVQTFDSAPDLWNQSIAPVSMRQFVTEVADTEKLLLFGETGSGKTHYYLNILEYQDMLGVKPKNLRMDIIFPDRPSGLAKLYNLIPDRYIDCVNVYQITDYKSTIRSTATAEKALRQHYQDTGHYGWMVFELMENYWQFSQDYYCREAYGTSMGEYFAQMQNIMSKDKADKKAAYEAFAGPFGGPWTIIKFFHNFNWIDIVKRYPFNTVFTSEIKAEENKDSIFYSLGYRPAGEKHNQHKMDTILYLSHKGNDFFMKPFKLTGYKRLYGELKITGLNGYEEHKKACQKLAKMGYAVSKMEDLEQQAGISPPKKEKPKEKKIESAPIVKGAPNMIKDIEEGLEELSEKEKKESTDEQWEL